MRRTVICYACNERMEREKEWLFLRRSNATQGEGEHDWSHTLVSAPGPEVITADRDQEMALVVDEGIARLEAKLDARLAALEDLHHHHHQHMLILMVSLTLYHALHLYFTFFW
ncbi:hypothetical protein OH76DRAFT_469701 [Lentinus brumalis]|uniref:Uncharacterized protein n=1 Tax=Lentinus brumalis TaxID=2498619 RepID=A0A371DCR9_9APHY|nr:hypothetical protein OH76DRAFT_469701 [Polyporus brumalis]